jgi:AcrR family transcriptional regulator
MKVAVKKHTIAINPVYQKIMECARDLTERKGVKGFTFAVLSNEVGISPQTLFEYIDNENDLVQKILAFERESFRIIFDEYDFDGVNSIDILLTVSKEMSQKFKNINPSSTFDLKKYYPEIYQDHFQKRVDFIFDQIKINIQKGINQGMYREDLSIELVARLYISRLIDIHNPDFFPPERFSFSMLFEVMFESFIRSIAKPEGLRYFEEKIKTVEFSSLR